MNTYDLTERIMAAETPADGEAILIEYIKQAKPKKISQSDSFGNVYGPSYYGANAIDQYEQNLLKESEKK